MATPKLSEDLNGESGDRTVFVEDVPSATAVASVGIGHVERGRGSQNPKKGIEDTRALRYFGNMLGLF